MKKEIFVFIFILCTFGLLIGQSDLNYKIDDLAFQITQNLLESKKAKIAIVEFSDLNGNISQLIIVSLTKFKLNKNKL